MVKRRRNMFGDLIGLDGQPLEFDDDLETSATNDGIGVDPEAVRVSIRMATHGGEDCAEVYAHGMATTEDSYEKTQRSVLLARVTAAELSMFPLVTASYRFNFLEPKYDDLKAIRIPAEPDDEWPIPEDIRSFDALLEDLPTGFGRRVRFGLGLRYGYRLIAEMIGGIPGVTELVIDPGDEARVDGSQFHLGKERFESIRLAIDSVARRASRRSLEDRKLVVFNELLHAADPDHFAKRFKVAKAGEIYELVKLGGRVQARSSADRQAAAMIVASSATAMAKEEPARLMELKAVIEQVTLAELIGQLEAMLGRNLIEGKWQAFFKANPFIIGLAFPYPMTLIQDQAHVGGTTITGAGESIADFLFAQHFTGNLALIEIKRPSTKLLDSKPFRGDLYAPHGQLTSAMAQILDQRSQLLDNFTSRSCDQKLKDTYVSAVHCIVIAGMVPTTVEERRSLDLFRHASKDVAVITFDELLGKLKEILRLMASSAPAGPKMDDAEIS